MTITKRQKKECGKLRNRARCACTSHLKNMEIAVYALESDKDKAKNISDCFKICREWLEAAKMVAV